MQLTLTTDYAIRCLICLSQNEGICTSQRVREYAEITSDEHTRKILRQLKHGGLVRSDKGANGGYSLARPLSEITFLDVLRCTEDTVKINRILESTRDGQESSERVAVRSFYEKTQQLFDVYFGNITVQDIMNGNLPDIRF